jgi:hypothetical protein
VTGNFRETAGLASRPKRKLLIWAILAILGFCCILLLSRFDLDGLLRFSDRLAVLPTVEASYTQISEKISNATHDVLLKTTFDNPLQLNRGRYAGCIDGGFDQIYGTNRSYNDVLADYAKVFTALGWTAGTGPQAGYSGYYIKSAKIVLNLITPSSPDYPLPAGQYITVYDVFFQFADPATEYCQG